MDAYTYYCDIYYDKEAKNVKAINIDGLGNEIMEGDSYYLIADEKGNEYQFKYIVDLDDFISFKIDRLGLYDFCDLMLGWSDEEFQKFYKANKDGLEPLDKYAIKNFVEALGHDDLLDALGVEDYVAGDEWQWQKIRN